MKKAAHEGLRTWIEIDAKALAANYRALRKVVGPSVMMMAVAKSNAYGHGMVEYAQAVEKLGADWLGVDSMVEGITLRKQGVKTPILVLGFTLPERFPEGADNDISITISNMEMLSRLLKEGKHNHRIHLKIDTGMHRQGLLPQEAILAISKLKSQKSKIVLEGIYTHFAAAKNPAFPQDTLNQLEQFNKVVAQYSAAGFKPIRHAAASAGALLYPQSHLDMVRFGISLYGLWPSPEVRAAREAQLTLKPILGWKTIVSELKKLPKGARVGYDLTETLTRDSTVAICPVGYWHGYPRSLSSIGKATLSSKFNLPDSKAGVQSSKVLGRVSMDMITIDVTEVRGVKVGEEVELLGSGFTADEFAELAGTSNYEVVTRLNPLMKRVYL